jgi:hypothetical protein
MTWPSPVRTDSQKVIERWVDGETLGSIASDYGVSRQYVHAVIKSEDPTAVERHAEHAALRRAEKAEARKVSREVREARARTEYASATRGNKAGFAERYSDQDMYEALAACAVDNGIAAGSMPGYTVYSRWYYSHPHKATLPSPPGIVRRYYGWNEAATTLGFAPNPPRHGAYKRKWNDAEIVAAIVTFVNEVGILNSGSQAYDTWARGKAVPSLAGIRLHGKWSHYRALAQDRLDAVRA